MGFGHAADYGGDLGWRAQVVAPAGWRGARRWDRRREDLDGGRDDEDFHSRGSTSHQWHGERGMAIDGDDRDTVEYVEPHWEEHGEGLEMIWEYIGIGISRSREHRHTTICKVPPGVCAAVREPRLPDRGSKLRIKMSNVT